jgi:hypothetical protein
MEERYKLSVTAPTDVTKEEFVSRLVTSVIKEYRERELSTSDRIRFDLNFDLDFDLTLRQRKNQEA